MYQVLVVGRVLVKTVLPGILVSLIKVSNRLMFIKKISKTNFVKYVVRIGILSVLIMMMEIINNVSNFYSIKIIERTKYQTQKTSAMT